MLILGLDPATTCGWALLTLEGERRASGVWKLPTDHAARLALFDEHLRALNRQWPGAVRCIGYEATNRHRSRAQARVAYGLEAVILLRASAWDCAALYPTAQQVKTTSGQTGRADKGAMLQSARERWGPGVQTHDEADALWVAEWTRTNTR